MLVMELVVRLRHTDRQAFVVGDARKMLAHLFDELVIDIQGVADAPQVPHYGLRRRLRLAVGERCDGGLELRNAELDALDIDQGRQAGYAMAVQRQRHVGG